jgi:peptidoglycan-associated lipoprotein
MTSTVQKEPRMSRFRISLFGLALAALVIVPACGGKKPVAAPGPAPFPGGTAGSQPGGVPPPPPGAGMTGTPTATPIGNDINNTPLDKFNENSPLKPVFFLYDSDELDETARATLSANAKLLQQSDNAKWVITVEGHCDERGSADYNLALGDRRALAARNYLQSLGVASARIRTVSYGKEFPFDPGHSETSWSQNRRAQFVVTSR